MLEERSDDLRATSCQGVLNAPNRVFMQISSPALFGLFRASGCRFRVVPGSFWGFLAAADAPAMSEIPNSALRKEYLLEAFNMKPSYV